MFVQKIWLEQTDILYEAKLSAKLQKIHEV
jgi:hypothetical protein